MRAEIRQPLGPVKVPGNQESCADRRSRVEHAIGVEMSQPRRPAGERGDERLHEFAVVLVGHRNPCAAGVGDAEGVVAARHQAERVHRPEGGDEMPGDRVPRFRDDGPERRGDGRVRIAVVRPADDAQASGRGGAHRALRSAIA